MDPSVGVLLDVQNTLVANAIHRWGTDDQQGRFLPRLAKSTVGAYALSEAASGSDAFALAATATRRASEYVLDGRKCWITNAREAGLSGKSAGDGTSTNALAPACACVFSA